MQLREFSFKIIRIRTLWAAPGAGGHSHAAWPLASQTSIRREKLFTGMFTRRCVGLEVVEAKCPRAPGGFALSDIQQNVPTRFEHFDNSGFLAVQH